MKKCSVPKEEPRSSSNRRICREEFSAITWNLWWCLVVCGAIAITGGSPEGDPKWCVTNAMLKAVAVSSRSYFWQSHEPLVHSSFRPAAGTNTACFAFHVCTGHGFLKQGHNCKPSYFLSYTTQAGKEAAGNPGFRSEVNHLGKILMYRIIFRRESADP